MNTNRIKEFRKMRKLTLEELAHKLGVSYSAIQKLESGTVDLDINWMRKLSEVLEVKPYELLPLDMQPEEITPQEREILRMIRKSSAPGQANSDHTQTQTELSSDITKQNQPSKER
jgi:transcriptional regulator with XRE-family HTH domain